MKRFKWLMALAALCMLATACGGSSSSKSSSSTSSKSVTGGTVAGKLVIDNESGSTWTCQFNPFNSAVTLDDVRLHLRAARVREHPSSNGANQTTPWLATSSQWSNGFKTLTFTIRNGSNLERRPAVQRGRRGLHVQRDEERQGDRPQRALDRGRRSADERDRQGRPGRRSPSPPPSQPYFYLVADQTPIVPKHIWSTLNQSKLHSYADTQPVGTGPYMMSNCAPQNIKYLQQPALLAEHARPSGAGGSRGRLPGVPQQHVGQPVPVAGPGAVGRPVRPEHPVVLHLEGSGAPPLLVRAGPERFPGPEPEQPAAEPAAGAAGDRIRDQQADGLAARGERLSAAGQPDGRRHAHLPELG